MNPGHAGVCLRCSIPTFWQDCPTGGWWIHQWPDKEIEAFMKDPANNVAHDADPGWNPQETETDDGKYETVPTEEYVP